MRAEQAHLEQEADATRRQLERLSRTILDARAGAAHMASLVNRASLGRLVPVGPTVPIETTIAEVGATLRRLRGMLPDDEGVLQRAVDAVMAYRSKTEESANTAVQVAHLEAKLINQGLEPYGGYASGGSGSSSDEDAEFGTDRETIKRRALAASKMQRKGTG